MVDCSITVTAELMAQLVAVLAASEGVTASALESVIPFCPHSQ